MKVEIVNLVATAVLDEAVDLDVLASLPSFRYQPEIYQCAYFRDEYMKATVSIFPSGKMIVTGSRSEESAREDLEHVVNMLRKHLSNSQICQMKFDVRNIVVIVNLERKLDLESLQKEVPGVIYEPEQFPAVIIRPVHSEGTVLVFSSGKMVVAGLKSTTTILESVYRILDELNLLSVSEEGVF